MPRPLYHSRAILQIPGTTPGEQGSMTTIASTTPVSEPLSPAAMRRGRRLAIGSHPMGMTFAMVLTQHLPTLALVALGASATVVGIQSAFVAAELVMLPTLRLVGRFSKRSILIAGQIAALVSAVPLLFFDRLAANSQAGGPAVWIALLSLGLVAVCMTASNTVWFPLLRSYVEPERIGRFFGTLRSGWHFALILYYLAARAWLDVHPGDYAPLFALAWLCGVARIAVIVRLPERSERTGERIRAREAMALVRTSPELRRYLRGAAWNSAVRASVIPFLIVMMRREVGFSSAHVLYTTAAFFSGGLVSLYLWGHVVDRVGPAPIFRIAAIGMGVLTAGLTLVEAPSTATLAALIAFFFLHSVLSSGFGVADTHVLFGLAPPDAPTRTLVIGAVVVRGLAGIAPFVVGLALDLFLSAGEAPLVVYHGFFAVAAVLQALSFWPLRTFRS